MTITKSKLKLIQYKTPLQELKSLSAFLKGPPIYIKRDDLISFGMGGNKVRKMEFYLFDAIRNGATTVISIGASHSNHTRAVTAAAVRLGLKAVVVVMGKASKVNTGNLLLNRILGANIVYTGHFIYDFNERLQIMKEIAADLEREGKKVFIVPVAGAKGCLGHYLACREVLSQARKRKLNLRHQVIAVGSGESSVGINEGAKETDFLITHGICIGRKAEEIKPVIFDLMGKTVELLGQSSFKDNSGLLLHDKYLGEAGEPTAEGIEAIRLLASLEGIFLDSVYTGKAMAGLIDLILSGEIARDEPVVFWHTGGASSLFSHEEHFQ